MGIRKKVVRGGGGNSFSPEDVSMSLEQGDHGLSTQARGDDELGRRRSMDLRDNESTDGQAVLSLLDMKVSPMEYIYPNDHL